MNIVRGPGPGGGNVGSAQAPMVPENYLRGEAMRMAVEWARSAGNEHCTRVPPAEFVAAAELFYKFLKGESA